MAARKPHRLGFRIEDQIKFPIPGFGYQLVMPLYVLGLDYKAEDSPLAGCNEVEHLSVVVSPHSHVHSQLIGYRTSLGRSG